MQYEVRITITGDTNDLNTSAGTTRAPQPTPSPSQEGNASGTLWEVDGARVANNEWLTLVYDYASGEVLAERTDPTPPSDEQIIDLLIDALDEYGTPGHCTILASRDEHDCIQEFLSEYGVRSVLCGTRLPHTYGAERAMRNRKGGRR